MVKITGARRHSQRLRRLPARTRREVGKAIFAGAGLIETEARRSIVAGAVQGAGHVPSPPGEPPNRDTGQLDQSITARKTGALTSETAVQAPYAAAQEFGHVYEDGRVLPERPYMRPATKKQRPKVVELVGKAAGRAVRSRR